MYSFRLEEKPFHNVSFFKHKNDFFLESLYNRANQSLEISCEILVVFYAVLVASFDFPDSFIELVL